MWKAIRAFWSEPAAPDPPPPNRRDWALTAILITGALVEASLRSAAWKPAQLVFVIGVALALPWRRTHPFAVAGSAFMAFGILSIATALAGGTGDDGLYTGAFDRGNRVLSLPCGTGSRGSLLAHVQRACG